MARNPISTVIDVAFLPARLAGRAASGVARQLSGGGREPDEPPAAPPPPRPKPLDDITIARKVESIVFRDRKVSKGKVDVNVADGVVWLRGEVKTPDLVNELERRAGEIPEVKRVENLLHLPKTPAPTRTDTPRSQRKTRRTKPRSADPKLTRTGVSGEGPEPAGAEPSPEQIAATRGGRRPPPLGSKGEEGDQAP